MNEAHKRLMKKNPQINKLDYDMLVDEGNAELWNFRWPSMIRGQWFRIRYEGDPDGWNCWINIDTERILNPNIPYDRTWIKILENKRSEKI